MFPVHKKLSFDASVSFDSFFLLYLKTFDKTLSHFKTYLYKLYNKKILYIT